MNKNSLSTNEELYHGEFLTSVDGKYKALFQVGHVYTSDHVIKGHNCILGVPTERLDFHYHQVDGNLVIYGESATWHSDTAQSTGARLILQNDGNFVLYTLKNSPVWITDTPKDVLSWRMRLTLTNSGHLELRRDGDIIWTSEKSNGLKLLNIDK